MRSLEEKICTETECATALGTHHVGLLGHKEVAGGVIVRPGLPWRALPQVEGVCKHGQREGKPAQLAH